LYQPLALSGPNQGWVNLAVVSRFGTFAASCKTESHDSRKAGTTPASTSGCGLTAAVLATLSGTTPGAQEVNDAGHVDVDDAQVLQRHPDGPVPAAVLHAGNAVDQHPARSGLLRAMADQGIDPLALLQKERGRSLTAPRRPGEGKQDPRHKKLRPRQACSGSIQLRERVGSWVHLEGMFSEKSR